jgi:hypothetical protein
LAKSKANKAWPLIRQWHVYVSVFVAPSLILFAITGALQTFRIPDRTDAPVLLQQLARVHRDDVFAVEQARPKPPESGKPAVAEKPKPKPRAKLSTEIAKWFFAATSVAIAVTTLFGLWMALAYSRRKRLMWALLIAGAVAPLVILAL